MTEDKNSDHSEVAKLKKGDFAAFDQLFEKYSSRIFYFAFGYLKMREEAEEVVQDVFLKIWEKRHHLNEDLSFRSYLFTISFNAIKKVVLKAAKKELALESLKVELEGLHFDQEYSLQTEEFQKIILDMIRKLPDRRREIFVMSRLEGKSNALISEELSISLKTVENQISEAKSFLKDNLRNYFPLLLFFAIFY